MITQLHKAAIMVQVLTSMRESTSNSFMRSRVSSMQLDNCRKDVTTPNMKYSAPWNIKVRSAAATMAPEQPGLAQSSAASLKDTGSLVTIHVRKPYHAAGATYLLFIRHYSYSATIILCKNNDRSSCFTLSLESASVVSSSTSFWY